MAVTKIFQEQDQKTVFGVLFGRSIFILTLLSPLSPEVEALAHQETEKSNMESTAQFDRISQRDNSEFIGVTTTAKITRQFEMYDPHSKEDLRVVKDMGFTQVILNRPHLHSEASELGLNVVLGNWWTKDTPQVDIERTIDLSKQVEAGRLAGISMMDEPGRNSPDTPFEYYMDLYQTLRLRLDCELPGVRLEISHWGPLLIWDERLYDYFAYLYEAADVMRIMPYPDLFEGPLNDVYFRISRSRKLMKIADRDLPLLVILQTWVLPPKLKLPEIDELRVMAYQVMLAGAETLSFFHYNPEVWGKTAGFHENFAGLMKELKHLSRRFVESTIESTMNANGVLEASITMPSGTTTTILVNTNRSSVDGLEPLAVIEAPTAKQLVTVRRQCRPSVRRICVEPQENATPPMIIWHLCRRIVQTFRCR